MSIKNRLKVNVTFEANIYMINIIKKLNEKIGDLEKVVNINYIWIIVYVT